VKKLFFTRQGLVVSLTISGIIMLMGLYLFVYVPENEELLKARRFRALERSQLNLQNRIENSYRFLETQLRSYTDKDVNPEHIQTYLSSLNEGKSEFRLSDVTKGTITNDTVDRTGKKTSNKTVYFDHDTVRCSYQLEKDKKRYGLCISYGSESFIRSLLPRNLFDEFLLIKDNEVLFATIPTGNQKIKPDSVLSFTTSLPVLSMGKVELAGVPYKIFLQPIRVDEKSQWILAGLLQEARFNRERTQLDPTEVLSLITISFLLIILLPWIKLFFMGSRDRLTHVDGFLSFIVAMFMVCLIFFVFARNLPSSRSSNYSESLTTLSDSIADAFQKELRVSKALLATFDAAIIKDTLVYDAVNLQKGKDPRFVASFTTKKLEKKAPRKERKLDSVLTALNDSLSLIRFQHVFWLNNKGMEICNWTSTEQNRPHQDFAERKYFNELGKRGGNNSDTIIEQVVSWTNGDFRTIISAASRLPQARAVAISVNLPSMEDHLLPEGFIAKIIDWRGNVYYDTEKSHNLNEYLPEEFADSTKLKSALYAGAVTEFITDYQGSKYHVRFTPLKDRYYLLLLRNQSFENSRDVNAFSFALSMYGLYFAIVLLQYICMVSLFSPVSSLRLRSRLVDTLFPSKTLAPAYKAAAGGNLLLIFLLVAFSSLQLLDHIYILLSAVALNTIYINLVCAARHQQEGDTRMAAAKRKNAWVLLGFLLLYNMVAVKMSSLIRIDMFFRFELLAAALLLLLYAWFTRVYFAKHVSSEPTSFLRYYGWMAITRMIITSGIPVLFFYIDGYNYEQTLQARHAQMSFGYRLQRMIKKDTSKFTQSFYKGSIFIDSNWISEYSLAQGLQTADETDTVFDAGYNLFDAMRILDDSISVANNNLYHNHVSRQEGWFSNANSFQRIIAGKNSVLTIQSSMPLLQLSSTLAWKYRYHWAMLLLALTALYFIIKRILANVFAIHFTAASAAADVANGTYLYEAGPPETVGGLLLHKTGCLQQEKRFNYLVAVPGAGTSEAIRSIQQMKTSAQQIFVLDILLAGEKIKGRDRNGWEEALQPKYSCVLIQHFESLVHNTALHAPVLDLLEKLVPRPAGSISILSSLHPVDFHDQLLARHESLKIADPKQATELAHLLYRWEDILGSFNIAFMGMTRLDTNANETDGLLRFLRQELQWGDFLNHCFKTYQYEMVNINTRARKARTHSDPAQPAGGGGMGMENTGEGTTVLS
jgi:hypothetical protein